MNSPCKGKRIKYVSAFALTGRWQSIQFPRVLPRAISSLPLQGVIEMRLIITDFHRNTLKVAKKWQGGICLWEKISNFAYMEKENKEKQLTDYEKYCQMMAQQQEEDMDELISGDMSEEAPEGVFVRGH